MHRHFFFFAVALALLLGALLPPSAQAAPRCFPEVAPAIADCIDGRIGEFWLQQGGLPVFGYPIGPQQALAPDAGAVQMQRFERARLELHPENAAPYDVLLGRLGAERLAQQGRDWQTFPKADPSAAHYFAQTGQAIAPQFWGYWSSHGLALGGRRSGGVRPLAESLALFGLPLSPATMETNPSDGRVYLTQWFERARLELHPEFAGTPNEVMLGLLQRELDSGAAAPPPAASVSGGFLQANGAQLVLNGQPVQLKGVNYYPQWRPWSEMWRSWDGPQVQRELQQARDQLGINSVRVLLTYNFSGTRDGDGQVSPKLIARLGEMAQIAGSLNLRLVVTLFDFYSSFPDAGSNSEARNLAYLRALIPHFADDDRILAWDIHNEPDNYNLWTDGNPQKVLRWIGRMADELHALAPHQLVTVGMGRADSLLLPGPDGRRAIDYSDVVSMHTYDAGSVAGDLARLRAQTGKPIVIEEFGWPSGPACQENYSEATQARLYQAVLAAARDQSAGVLAWTLRDYDAGPTDRWDSREEHFGLVRPDGSLKPAAELLRAFPAPALPSTHVTNQPLSSLNPQLPGGMDGPLLVPDSGHYVKGMFRQAWELLGGRASFGLPLTEAYVRQSDRVVVQYFEAGLLEYHPEAIGDQQGLPLLEQVLRSIQLAGLGSAAAAGRALPPPSAPQGPFLAFYQGIQGGWRLGAPISAELVETINGVPIRVQYFEKGRLELNPSTQSVAVGPLGKLALDTRCAMQ